MPTSKLSFPPDFVWGTATSAYQIEGATHEDGRGESIWDRFCRQPGAIADASNGDVACDHYHLLADDIALIDALGVQAYRFSVSWPRVQPHGSGGWNSRGFDFYDRLIDGLLERGISPHATLYHWDLPQALQDRGGWADRDVTARFVDYAVKVATRFGDRVGSIATLNEPWVVATLGHEKGIFAPGIKDRRIAMQVSHHLLLAHGMAVQAMGAAGVSVPLGIVVNQSPILAASDSAADLAKARLDDGLLVRWYMDPLLRAEYPQDVLEYLHEDAPRVQEGDMQAIATPIDFLGLNYYTRSIVSAEGGTPHFDADSSTDMGWEVYPAGLTETLRRLHKDYRLPPIYVTENGAAYADEVNVHETAGERVHDTRRVEYLSSHIAALHQALAEGIDVRGYFVWSLLDNFEWAFGYDKRFGIVYVDYESLRRIPKDSALWYRDFIKAQLALGALPTKGS